MLHDLVIEPTPLPHPTRREVAHRVGRATRIASRNLVTARRRGKLDEAAVAGVIRRTFEDLGGTFTKFGQLITSSPSIFGDEVAHEFRACLDAGPAVLFAKFRRAVETDLGRPLEAMYSSFGEVPIAAASLAVVHR